MSASKDKINRKQQIEAGTDKRSLAAAEEAKKRRKSNIQYTVIAVILVVVFAFIFIYNSTFPSRHTTAVTIDGQDYTVAQLNYYYSNAYNTFYSNYYQYIAYGLFFDTSTSLGDQMYSEDMTWREYFLESAVNNMTQVQILNKAAEAEGYTLTEEEQAQYEEAVTNIETSWADLGYSSLEQYINMNFGKGVDMDLIRQELYRTYVASSYSQHLYDSYDYSIEELEAYYAENADDFDVITYTYYTDYDGTVDADAAAAELNGADADEFAAYMEENYSVTPNTLSYSGSNLPDSYSDWLLDAARVPGDTTVVTGDDSTTVVMFDERDTNDYNTVSFRHILFQAEDADGDGIYSAEELAIPAGEAQVVYEDWLDGDMTEDRFATLANTYSDDTGSNTTGGLYENATKGQMVDPIDEWLFDEARQPGDTEIISYEGSNYTGTHIVYFVGTSEMTSAQSIADSTLRTDAYNSWLQEQQDAAVVTTSHLGMCGKNH